MAPPPALSPPTLPPLGATMLLANARCPPLALLVVVVNPAELRRMLSLRTFCSCLARSRSSAVMSVLGTTIDWLSCRAIPRLDGAVPDSDSWILLSMEVDASSMSVSDFLKSLFFFKEAVTDPSIALGPAD